MKTCPVCDTPYEDQRTTCPTDGASLIESHEMAPGYVVRGKYRIVRKLGQGGMGTVYLAEHMLLGGQAALKFLATELSKNPQFVKRFRNEARAAYQLRHPNIVEVADLDQDEDGSLFIAMEFIHGPSLRAVLREANGPLTAPRALSIARGVAAGLSAAHARGAIHRDIKPENILIAQDAEGREVPKVLDFGIAAMTDNITSLSRTHGLLLTPEYASPEQWRGTAASELDGRTDLYALGGILYEMLAGRTPFRAVNAEGWMFQHLNGIPEPLSMLRPDLCAEFPGLEAVVMSLLARERDQRIPSAVAFIEAIAPWSPATRYFESQNVPSIRTGAPETPLPSARSGPQLTSAPPGPPPASAGSVPIGLSPASSTANPPAPVTGAPQFAASQPIQINAGQTNAGTLSALQGSHRNVLALVAGAILLAGAVAFLAAWLVFRPAASLPVAEIPKLFPPGGRYNSPQTIILTDATPNATIHYTLDGTPPNASSPTYTKPLDSVPDGATLRAVATADGHKQSPSIIAFYTWPTGPAESPGTPDAFQQGKDAFDHKQYAQARTSFGQSCDGGNLDACNYLGYLLSKGLGGAADVTGARRIFQKACDGGNLNSCVSLGSLYQDSGNTAEARKDFQKACSGGSSQACTLLHNLQ